MSTLIQTAESFTRSYKVTMNAGLSVEISITFTNGQFKEAKFPFAGAYTREHWRILRGIEAEISRIEDELHGPKAA